MGKKLIIKGADFSANALEPHGVQVIAPSLSSGGSELRNQNNSFLGPQIMVAHSGKITKILSSLNLTTICRICIADPVTNKVTYISQDITLQGTTTDISALNIQVPAGSFIGFGNKYSGQSLGPAGQNSIFFVADAGTPHFQAPSASVGSSITQNYFATMKITVGCEIQY